LDSRFEDHTLPWNRIREIVAGLNIHLFPAAPTKRHHLLMYKCVYPKKELKFSITLKKRKYSKGVCSRSRSHQFLCALLRLHS
jgi:hypothetical protein